MREELGQAAGSGARWEDALLVVSELGEDEVEVAVALVLVDLGEKLGLGPAGARLWWSRVLELSECPATCARRGFHD
ncbi:hypothetical protein [Streptomyces albidoflavus]|uniref:hypothetical protein n=1 Tax=Streptomyces albidoflavus TaxID=1886 RepID=UPI0033CA5CBF